MSFKLLFRPEHYLFWLLLSSATKNQSLLGPILPKKSDKDAFERIWSMYKQIRTLIKAECPDCVVFEDVGMDTIGRNVMVLKQLARLQGCLIALCYECGVRFEIVYPATWRSTLGFLKGKSKEERRRDALKQMAIDYANTNYGLNLKMEDNDIADAVCIASSFLIMKNGLDKEK